MLEQLEPFFSFDVRPFTKIVHFESGETIFREGESADCLYYLVAGRVKIMMTQANGKQTLNGFLDAPTFIGEMELLGVREETNSVTAVLPCTCYRIDSRACSAQLLCDAKFLQRLCIDMAQRFVKEAENFSKNLSYPAEVRLAQFILLSSNDGIYREKHTEVAAYLGITYRHYMYVLAGFVKRGILQKTSQRYRILDADALARLANEV